MYYKILKDGSPIDVLEKVTFLKYNQKHKRFFNAEEKDAQAIKSSDRKTIWHEISLYPIPVDGYETVEMKKIDMYEYNKLKFELATSIESIIDQYTLELLERGVL